MLSSHLALPQEGHLEEFLHVFSYLQKHINFKLVFDPTTPERDMNASKNKYLAYSIYSTPGEELKEEVLHDLSKSLGQP